ncbi:hypothetical protein ACODT3_15640 [Streptomyces sp. 4.24]|uniref:hypothetical protein n=1 Tax=Streptomyces tritrimontium TaxID=3406573 RepID=UPI003BB6698A
MNELKTGSRTWRVLVHSAYAVLSGLAGAGALIAAVVSAAAGSEGSSWADSSRDHVTGVLTLLFLAVLCLDLARKLTRDALALHRADRPADAEVAAGIALALGCAYGAVSGLVLSTAADGVPLWGVLLVMGGPPLALTALRAPKAISARRERTTARAAARAAARPVVTTRNPGATRRTTRAQRRGAS